MKSSVIFLGLVLIMFISGCESTMEDEIIDDATTPPLFKEEDQRDLIVESSPSSPISVKMTVDGFDGKNKLKIDEVTAKLLSKIKLFV